MTDFPPRDLMTGQGLKSARQSLGLSIAQMAKLLGHKGENTRKSYMRKEEGEADISPLYARMMQAYLDGYRPPDWPDAPD